MLRAGEEGQLRGQGRGALMVTGLEPGPAGRCRRRSRVVLALSGADALALGIGWVVATAGPGSPDRLPQGVPGPAAFVMALAPWLALIAAGRGYDVAGMAWPPRRAVLDAAVRYTAAAAMLLLLVSPAAARLLLAGVPAALSSSLVLRAWVRAVAGRSRSPARVLLVGGAEAVARVGERLAARQTARRAPAVRVVGRCLTDSGPELSGEVLRRRLTASVRAAGADAVLLADPAAFPAPSLRRLAWTLHAGGIGLQLAAGPPGVGASRLRVEAVDADLSVLRVEAPAFTGVRRVVKDVADRCGASVLLVLLAPVLLATALAVRLSGPGPVIFRQVRVGRHGERFVMWKFRSMRADAPAWRERLESGNDHADGVLFKMHGDPRVTGVGRVLRRLSLDELPQLVNVVRGEMSLVGPRPALPAEVDRYEPDVLRRLLVKPGMSGLWQVSGRADLDWAETVRLDLGYVENWSLALDTDILVRTLRAVLLGTGAR